MLFYSSQMSSRSSSAELPTDSFQWHTNECYLTIDEIFACKTFSFNVYTPVLSEMPIKLMIWSMNDTLINVWNDARIYYCNNWLCDEIDFWLAWKCVKKSLNIKNTCQMNMTFGGYVQYPKGCIQWMVRHSDSFQLMERFFSASFERWISFQLISNNKKTHFYNSPIIFLHVFFNNPLFIMLKFIIKISDGNLKCVLLWNGPYLWICDICYSNILVSIRFGLRIEC